MENLNKEVQQIKNALNQVSGKGTGLILYIATQFTQQLITALAKQDVAPLCICDSNSELYGSEMFGLEIMSMDTTKE